MDHPYRNKQKKKDRKPIYILFAFLIFFGFFIFLLTRPSLQAKAIDEAQLCYNVNDVKMVFEKYKFELLESDANGNKIVSVEFQDQVRKKLNSFNLNEKEITECLQWLPTAKTSLNLIVIPDLSRRIIDDPNQIQNDIIVLKAIWKSFVEYSKFRQDTKDRLLVDVTDIQQAKGQFGAIANQLVFDLNTHQGKSNRLYFTSAKDDQFNIAIEKMYESAKEKPLGADYLFYFRRYLINHIKKPTLFDNYVNKVIIITDGYLEAEDRPADTKITSQLVNSVSTGNVKNMISLLGLNIPQSPIDLSNTDVLICEVNERLSGKNRDYDILKAYWEDWLERMKAHRIEVIEREKASDLTINKVRNFIAK